jgi:hypothetical protein
MGQASAMHPARHAPCAHACAPSPCTHHSQPKHHSAPAPCTCAPSLCTHHSQPAMRCAHPMHPMVDTHRSSPWPSPRPLHARSHNAAHDASTPPPLASSALASSAVTLGQHSRVWLWHRSCCSVARAVQQPSLLRVPYLHWCGWWGLALQLTCGRRRLQRFGTSLSMLALVRPTSLLLGEHSHPLKFTRTPPPAPRQRDCSPSAALSRIASSMCSTGS